MKDFEILPFEEKHLEMVIDFEKELRRQEPDTYYWEPDPSRTAGSTPRYPLSLSGTEK